MKLEDVEKLILLMQKHDLSELSLKEEGLEFSARRGDKQPQQVYVQAPQVQSGMYPATSGMLPAVPPLPSVSQPAAGGKPTKEITAPIVGTFYRAPSPDQPPFKEVGDHVSADDVVCIVEAMKVMNEIKSGVTGTIKKILIDNATPVEYGQPLFLVEVG
jgi:acetyl-CoA carboxylase biotin carboxyl carrier protein